MPERTATGWLFSLVGGALTTIFGFFIAKAGFDVLYPAATGAPGQLLINEGMIVAAAGLFMLFGSTAIYAMPEERRRWSALVVALSVLGWIEGAAFAIGQGLADLYLAVSVGPVLGLVGGILGLLWSPTAE